MLINAYHEHKQQGHKALNEGYVRITSFNKDFNEEETEKTPVIATIEELQQRGYAPGDIAILVRSNHDGTEIAKQLLQDCTSRVSLLLRFGNARSTYNRECPYRNIYHCRI